MERDPVLESHDSFDRIISLGLDGAEGRHLAVLDETGAGSASFPTPAKFFIFARKEFHGGAYSDLTTFSYPPFPSQASHLSAGSHRVAFA